MLTVSTNGSYDDVTQSKAAGMAEGYITADHIMMYYNATAAGYCDNNPDFCSKLKEFIESNEKWIQNELEANKFDPYWNHVSVYFIIMKY